MKGYFRKIGSKWSFGLDVGKHPDGRRKQVSRSGFSTKREAQQACQEMIQQIQRGVNVQNKSTVGEYLLMWIDVHRAKLSNSTYENHLIVIEKRIIPEIGSEKMNEITALAVERFYQKLLQTYSIDYVKYMHSILRKAMSQAKKWNLLPINFMEAVNPPRGKKKEIITWTIEEANQFLEAAKGHHHYIGFSLAIYTGMRRGEILGMRWSDIDFDAGRLHVVQTVTRTKMDGIVFGGTKTAGSTRQIAVDSILLNDLRDHKKYQASIRLELGPAYMNHDLVVAKEDGNPLSPRQFLKYFEKIVGDAQIPKIRFHDMRHTHATIMLKLGQNPKVVAERLGHASIQTLLDTYSHVIPDMQKSAADIFGEAMKTGKKSVDNS